MKRYDHDMTKDKYDEEAEKLLPCAISAQHDCSGVICIDCRHAVAARLREQAAEIERLKALENKMGSGWVLVEYEKLEKDNADLRRQLEQNKKGPA